MLRKYKDPLNQMYEQHPGLCDKLISVINHPLNSTEFEAAWKQMMVEFNLHQRKTFDKLYDERKIWIASYLKEIFCGTIQSTQRSESVNAVVKVGYVDNGTPNS